MYIPLTLIHLSTVSWPTSLPVPGTGQTAVTVPITSPTPNPMTISFEKRQPAYAPVETHEPILEVLAGSTADALKERASGANDGFDSLLCALLKILKGENPSVFTGLLQSCTSMIDSSSSRGTKTLKQRNFIDDKENVVADAEADVDGSGDAIVGRSENDLPVKRDIDISNLVEKRQTKASIGSFAPR